MGVPGVPYGGTKVALFRSPGANFGGQDGGESDPADPKKYPRDPTFFIIPPLGDNKSTRSQRAKSTKRTLARTKAKKNIGDT